MPYFAESRSIFDRIAAEADRNFTRQRCGLVMLVNEILIGTDRNPTNNQLWSDRTATGLQPMLARFPLVSIIGHDVGE